MNLEVHCAFCPTVADHFYSTLDNTLWAVCGAHTAPFKRTAIRLDPNKYDLESYFSEYLDRSK